MSDLIWVQTVYKVYQQAIKVVASEERANMPSECIVVFSLQNLISFFEKKSVGPDQLAS